jgi:CspA family cold shock protein
MAKGTVKWFDLKKGFGFIINEQGQDVFVHYTNLDGEGFRCLRLGQIVEYKQLDTDKGLQGRKVQIISVKPPVVASTKAEQAGVKSGS